MKSLKRGQTIYLWWSSSEVYGVKFIRWAKIKRMDGQNSHKLGVGPIVYSDFLFSKLFIKRPKHGLRRNYSVICPYNELYLNYEDARARRNPINKPDIKRVKSIKGK